MKVLGITEVQGKYSKERAYIVQITHGEVAKVADKAAYRDDFKELKAGDDYPISEGHDFRREIIEAIQSMQSAHARFAESSATMARFVGLVLPRAEAEQQEATGDSA